jgi:transposase-like protein
LCLLGVCISKIDAAPALVAPAQIAGRYEPFRSAIREHLKGHTQRLEDLGIEMLARGLSVRDIEDAFEDENGRLLLSKTAASQLGERLWGDYQAFAQRDLSEYEITYLFVDGIAERLRRGAKREPLPAAWALRPGAVACCCIR